MSDMQTGQRQFQKSTAPFAAAAAQRTSPFVTAPIGISASKTTRTEMTFMGGQHMNNTLKVGDKVFAK